MRVSQEKNDANSTLQRVRFEVLRRGRGWIILLLCLCCWEIGAVFKNQYGWAEVIDKIAAILDQNVILLSEVREYTDKPIVQILIHTDASENIDQQTLRYLLERHLLSREIHYLAFPQEMEVTKAVVLEYIIQKYSVQDAETLEQKIQEYGIMQEELEQELIPYIKGVEYIRRKNRFGEDVEKPEVLLKLFRQWIEELHAQANIQMFL